VNERSVSNGICGTDKAVVTAGRRSIAEHPFTPFLGPSFAYQISMAILLSRFRVAREEQFQLPENVL
jgi:hypothetical protein